MVRSLGQNVWAPIPTFFLPVSEDLDVPTFVAHVVYLAKAGLYPVIAGSMGEAHHLSPSERITLITSARKALDDAGLPEVPIIAGTGVGSTRETIKLSKEAAEAGADCAIVIASGYFAGAMSKEALVKFFVDVAESSPIPVMIYNYPGAAGGIDLTSNDINAIADGSSNIVGVKLTCGGVGKLTRITGHTTTKAFVSARAGKEFVTLGGFADFILPTVLGSKADGAIMGLANLYPYSISKLFKLSLSLLDPALPNWQAVHAEAFALQTLVSEADFAYAPLGISGTKATLQKRRGYGGVTRLPLLPFEEGRVEATDALHAIVAINEVEDRLAGAVKANGVNGH
ncbi:dihydrodipicolinate synthetase [Mrakia frigida]|uniref:dihydrodipicolinate synthase family protein n=1 Tax=Mrakia frigida TaxID=29902 RepID=UPI003FCC0323